MRRFFSAALALCISVTSFSFSAKEVMAETIDGGAVIEEKTDEADYNSDSDNSEELEVLDNSEDNDNSENALEGSSEYDSFIEDASEEISIETEEGASENSSTDDAEDIAFEEYDSIGGEYEAIKIDLTKEVMNFGGFPKDSSYNTFAQDYSDLDEDLSKAIGSYTRIVDLKDYDLSTAEAQERIIDYLNQEAYGFVVNEVNVLSDKNSDKALAYEIGYAEDAAKKSHNFEKAVDAILSGVDENWSDMAKVCYLVKKICETCDYDYTYTHYGKYDALVLHTSVCNGYAEAFCFLANEIGIKTELVISKANNHAWNVSYIDGEAYFTDCTWSDFDDPSPSTGLETGLKDVLLSLETDRTQVHNNDDWSKDYEKYPSSMKYESLLRPEGAYQVASRIYDTIKIYVEEDYPFKTDNEYRIKKLDLNSLKTETICTTSNLIEALEYDGEYYYYVDYYYEQIATPRIETHYYNRVYSVTPDGKERKLLYTFEQEIEKETEEGKISTNIGAIKRSGDGLDCHIYKTIYPTKGGSRSELDHIEHVSLEGSKDIVATNLELISDEYRFSKVGETKNILKSLVPSNATNIKWKSTNPDVATISDGVITCNGYGHSTIIAEAGSLRATCLVYLDTSWQEDYEYLVVNHVVDDLYTDERMNFGNELIILKSKIQSENSLIQARAVVEGIDYKTVIAKGSFLEDNNIRNVKFEEGVLYDYNPNNHIKYDPGNMLEYFGPFSYCENLVSVYFDGVKDFYSNKNTMLDRSFMHCPNLQYVSFNGSELGSVSDFSYSFSWGPSLKEVDLSGVKLDAVKSSSKAEGVFYDSPNVEKIHTPAAVNPEFSIKIPEMVEYKDGIYGTEVYTDLMKAPLNTLLVRKPSSDAIDISDATVKLERDSFVYDGKEKKPEVTVTKAKKTLVRNTDYTVVYKDNINPGIASVVVTGIGKYKGSKTVTFTIVMPAEDVKVVSPTANIPSGQVEYKTPIILSTATPGADIYYTLDGSNPTSEAELYSEPIIVDKENLVIKAIATKESMKDSDVVTFTYTATQDWGDITSPAIRGQFGNDIAKVPEGLWFIFGNEKEGYGSYIRYGNYTKSSVASFVYTGTRISFNDKISVYHGNKKLCENRDYSLKYSNNTNAGSGSGSKAPKVTITGKGNYKSTCSFYFSINAADINTAVMTTDPEVVINAGTKLSTVKPALTFNGKKLSVGKDYQLFYYRHSVDDKNRINNGNETVQSGTKYFVVVKGAAEVSGSKSVNFGNTYDTIVTVEAVDPKNKTVVKASSLKVTVPKQVYTGSVTDAVKLFDNAGGKTPAVVIKNGKDTLIYGEDFTVSLSKSTDHKSSGKHTIILTGTKNAEKEIKYVGSKAVSYEIIGTKMSGVKVAGLNTAVEYSGNEFTLNELFKADSVTQSNGYKAVTLYTTVKSGSTKTCKALTEGTDYTVKMDNNGSTGSFNIAFIGMGAYSGTLNKKITVKAYNLKTDSRKAISITASDAVYSKAGAVPTVTVKCNGKVLKEGLDYKLSFKNNKVVSGAKKLTVVIKGMGNYTGVNSETTFNIAKADIKSAVTLVSADKPYKAKAAAGYFKSVPKLMDNGSALSVGKGKDVEPINSADYHYYYADTHGEIDTKALVSAGTLIEVRVKVTCSAKSPYKEGVYELIGYYQILDNGHDISKATVTIKDAGKLSYDNGRDIVPLKERDLLVKIGKKTLSSDDYEIVSVTNNHFVGQATITIRGKGKYGGSKKAVFKIGAKPIDANTVVKSS